MRHFVHAMFCALGATVACSSAPGPNSTEEIPSLLTAAGVTRVDHAQDGSDVFLGAHGARLGGAIVTQKDGAYAIDLSWGERSAAMSWDATKFALQCGGASVTYDVSNDSATGSLTDDCRPLADISDGVAALHQMPSPIKSVLARGQTQEVHTEMAAFEMECGGGVYYTDWGFSASGACGAAHRDCFTGGVDFCVQTSQSCGPIYCTCTYFNVCANAY